MHKSPWYKAAITSAVALVSLTLAWLAIAALNFLHSYNHLRSTDAVPDRIILPPWASASGVGLLCLAVIAMLVSMVGLMAQRARDRMRPLRELRTLAKVAFGFAAVSAMAGLRLAYVKSIIKSKDTVLGEALNPVNAVTLLVFLATGFVALLLLLAAVVFVIADRTRNGRSS